MKFGISICNIFLINICIHLCIIFKLKTKNINKWIKFKIFAIFLLLWIFMALWKNFESFKFTTSFEEWLLNDELGKIYEYSMKFHST